MAGKVKSFEELRVFQEARELAGVVYKLTRTGPLAKDYVLRDQMWRAAVSIVSNIAEGFERETRAEFSRALFIARGSCAELRAQALLAVDQRLMGDVQHAEINDRCKKLGGGVYNLIRYLKQDTTHK